MAKNGEICHFCGNNFFRRVVGIMEGENKVKSFMRNEWRQSDQQIVKTNERYFKFFLRFPLVCSIFFAVACFLCGSLFASIEEESFYLAIFWVGGPIYCVMNYFLLKIIFSPMILKVYYLKMIANSGDTSTMNKSEDDPLPEI